MKVFDVFISYRWDDGKETAKQLYDWLTDMGMSVFMDESKMVDGHRFNKQIAVALEAAPHYILIGSDLALSYRDGEHWVHKEMALALSHYKEDMGNRTITILLPENAPFPKRENLPPHLQDIMDFQVIPFRERARIREVLTAVSHANLWHASHKWLLKQKQPGGRFCDLQINENLIPTALRQLPVQVEDDWQTSDLLDAVSRESGHMCLIGQGGIGKTTALMKMMNDAYENKAYEEDSVVPLFVELSAAPDTFGSLYQEGNSSFIRRSVFRQLRYQKRRQQPDETFEKLDSCFTQPYDVAVKPLDELLKKQTETPQFLLLLDGMNELSTVKLDETGSTVAEMVIREIQYLANCCPNVRLVLTSRSDIQLLQDDRFSQLKLAGVSDEVVNQYLQEKKVQCELTPEMMEILRIPLFLIMYTELSSVEGICTQGEILHRFFSGRKNMEYTMRSRLDRIAETAKQLSVAVAKTRIDPSMHSFLLDFVLPEIGWHMVRNETVRLSGRQLRQVIWKVLTSCEDMDVCGDFGMDAFRTDRSTFAVAETLVQRLGGEARRVCENVADLFTFTLGVLKYADGDYSFTHQHIRDYFAAKKGINTLRLAIYMQDHQEPELAYTCVEAAFGHYVPDWTVCRFIGEVLQEYRNAPVEENGRYGLPAATGDRGLLSRALDIYRKRFPGGKGITTLVSILRDARKNLAGCDFGDLDLSACDLSGTALCAGKLQANFRNTCIRGETLLYVGHTGYLNAVDYAGNEILTAGSDGKVLHYDADTGRCKQLTNLAGPVWYAKMLSDGTLLTVSDSWPHVPRLTLMEQILVQRTDPVSGETLSKLELSSQAWVIRLSRDEKLLALQWTDRVLVVDVQSLTLLRKITTHEDNMVAEFLGDSYEILLSDGSTVNALTGEKGQFLPLREREDFFWLTAAYGDIFCTMTQKGDTQHLEVYSARSGALLHSFAQSAGSAQRDVRIAVHHIPEKYYRMVFSDQGQHLALTTPTDVHIYETRQWQLLQRLEKMAGQYINSVAFADESRRMAVGLHDGSLCLCETAGFAPVRYHRGLGGSIREMELSSDGEDLVTYSQDGILRHWDLRDKTLTASRFVGQREDLSIGITQRDTLVCVRTQGRDACGSIENVYQYFALPTLEPYTGETGQLSYRTVRDTSHRDQIHIYSEGEHRYTVYGDEVWICDPYLFVKGRSNWGEYVNCYDLESGSLVWGYTTCTMFRVVRVTDRYLLTAEADDTVVVYDSANGEKLGEQRLRFGHRDEVCGDFALTYHGHTQEYTTRIYRLPELQLLQTVEGHLYFSEDGAWAQVDRMLADGRRYLDVYRVADRVKVASFCLPVADVAGMIGIGSAYTRLESGCFAVRLPMENACVYRVEGQLPCVPVGEFEMQPGMEIMRLDLSSLHPDSRITSRQKEILRTYGAIL